MPNYFQEIKENKLGTIILGTNLCLGILQRFNSNYKNEMPKAAQHTIFTKNLTSGQVVKLNLKRNIGLKQTISYFVKKSYQSLLWEQRRYFDGAVHSSQDFNRNFNNANSQGKKTERRNKEESWYKEPKRKRKP